MIERIKASPLSVKIAIGILGLCVLSLLYIAPFMVTIGLAITWALKTVIDYFVDEAMK